jgi:hypothetical protein
VKGLLESMMPDDSGSERIIGTSGRAGGRAGGGGAADAIFFLSSLLIWS